ncbi:MAG: alpha/beta hydrolase [Candidatus Tectomicrobia bacterium]|nr:alpha/beta hydrolase [Candidatus Tectomicrobia bacterium]
MGTLVKGVDKAAVVNGLRLHYLEWGNEGHPTMILLHGLTSHAHSWDHFASAMSEEYHIFALDQRGHGDSEWSRESAYSTSNYVSDLDALVKVLGIGRFVLIGLSMGAHNSMSFAAYYPERVEKLVPVDIGAAYQHPGPEEMKKRRASLKTEFDSLDEVVAQARQMNPRASDEMLRYRVEHGTKKLSNGKITFKYDSNASIHWNPKDLWMSLPTIKCPTLIVRGAESDVLTQTEAEKMEKTISGSRLVVIEGAGHTIPADQPEKFEEAVRSFLTG